MEQVMSAAAAICPTIERPTFSRLEFVDGTYRTPPRKISWLARRFPSFTFHPRLIAAVFRASAKARRSTYSDADWSHTSRVVMRALEGVGVQFEISGMQHLEKLDVPCVIAANHTGTLETAILPTIIAPFRRVTFVVKEALINYPVFKHVMRSREPIALSQNDPRADLKITLVEGVERLHRGISVVVFPEGSRSPAFKPECFNTIGIKLAHRAGVPIVPLALSTHAWALGRGPFTDFGPIDPSKPVKFAFGEPMWVQGRGTEQHRAVIDFIQAKLNAWRDEKA
jgi:1-acyl-sn-glycerol-3-phosphate acyltransferase